MFTDEQFEFFGKRSVINAKEAVSFTQALNNQLANDEGGQTEQAILIFIPYSSEMNK